MPTKVGEGDETSPLDDAIGMGMSLLADNATAENEAIRTIVTDLGAVVNPMFANCGGGNPDYERRRNGRRQRYGRSRIQRHEQRRHRH